MAKAADMMKAKQARQKKIAIIGGVLFLALIAFQVPRTMKMLETKPPPAVAAPPPGAAAPATSAPSFAPPALGGAPATGAPTPAPGAAPSDLEDSDPLPQAANGQLISFGRFDSKDPFVPQVEDGLAAPGPTAASPTPPNGKGGGGKTGGAGAPGETGGFELPEIDLPESEQPSGASTKPAAPTSAAISVNGIQQTVKVGDTFPAESPVFVLVAVTKEGAKVAIDGGSYESGAATVTLRPGKTLTLQNTADGSRYTLRLISVG